MATNNVAVIPAFNEMRSIESTLMHLVPQELNGIVVVNNNSDDDTAGVVKRVQSRFPSSNIHLLDEKQQGIGFACRTGFRYAIDELGAKIISRTDSDTVPTISWAVAIKQYFAAHPTKQLIGGPETALKDVFYRRHDVAWPLLRWSARMGAAALYRSVLPLKLAVGHNMAVRSKAYDEVDGFPPVARDEDMILTRKIAALYGSNALGYNRAMKVAVSLRRVRHLGGYMGIVGYYNADTQKVDDRAQIAGDAIR